MKLEKPTGQKSSNRFFPLNMIYFYLTEGCNLACRHCWITPKYQIQGTTYRSLDFNLFRSIIEQANPLGLSGVKLTGGEPLLYPQIHEMLEFIRTENLCLTVETNGVLCTPVIAQEMARCKNPFVSVSLDGVNAETHEWVRGVKGCFKAALDGIRNLVKAGFRPQIIMTIMHQNKDQIEPMVRFAESLGAGSVKFNHVQPMGGGVKLHEFGETLPIDELVNLGQWVENALASLTNLRVYYSEPMAFRPLNKILDRNGDGCSTCRILGILGVLGNGSYALCGIGETVPELVFGHAATDRLEDVWNDAPVLLELREGIPQLFEGICGNCLMKPRCLGSCLAQNYYRSKNIWAGYWYCDEAQKHGLFPDTRIISKHWRES